MKRGNDGNSDFDKLLKNQSDEVLDAINVYRILLLMNIRQKIIFKLIKM